MPRHESILAGRPLKTDGLRHVWVRFKTPWGGDDKRNSFITARSFFGPGIEIGFVLKIVLPGFSREVKGGSVAAPGSELLFDAARSLRSMARAWLYCRSYVASRRCWRAKAWEDGGEDGSGAGGRVLARHLELKASGLNSPHAQQTPASGDHGLDQRGFGGIARLKLEDERRGEVVEAAHRFAFEDDGAGKKAVSGGAHHCVALSRVLGRNSLAFRRDGARGFLGVGLIGLDLTFGCHYGFRVRVGWAKRGRDAVGG